MIRKKAAVSAPGKVIISGEHSVVYGKPALVAAFGLRTKTEVSLTEDKNTVLLSSDKIGEKKIFREELTEYWQVARTAWNEYAKTGELGKLKRLRKDKFAVMLGAAGSVLDEIEEFPGGLKIEVKSKLPVISGFGASAYVASTVIGSLKIMSGKNLTLEELNKLTYEVEKIIHGRPSGADPTTVVYGGVIKFSKTNDKFEFRKINFDKKIKKKKMWLINSGKASESTGEMVELVRKKMERQRIKFSKIITKMGEITDLIIRSFENGVIETELIEENERRLEELGVVGERAKAMIKKIEAVEGAAKISGAGGVKSGSGLILVYHKDPNLMEEIIKQEAWQSFDGKTGGAGWRRE